MSHTVQRPVDPTGRPYRIIGADKVTVTDVTVTTNSETVTAAELGLNAIWTAQADIDTGQATDTGTYAKATVAANNSSITLAEFTAAGAAATTAANTVIRVTAKGY
jgi:hypothetical protein